MRVCGANAPLLPGIVPSMSADRTPDAQPQNPPTSPDPLGGMMYAPLGDAPQQGTDAAGADGFYGGAEVDPAAAAGSAPAAATGEVEAQREQKSTSKTGTGTRIAQVAAAVLFLLAVVATTVMVFTDNGLWMRVGLLAALWSALFGAFLYAWERRRSGQAEQREAELKRVYSLELESEVAARREHDLRVKEALREEVRSENEQALDALRVEVMALRSQLEQLGVQPIVDTGRAVAGAAAQRIITAAPGGAAVAGGTGPLDSGAGGGAEGTGAKGSGAEPTTTVKPLVDGFEQLITEPSTAAPSGEVPPRPVVGGKRPGAHPQTGAPTPSNEVTSTLRTIDATGTPHPGGAPSSEGRTAAPTARAGARPQPPITPRSDQPQQAPPITPRGNQPQQAPRSAGTADRPAAAAPATAPEVRPGPAHAAKPAAKRATTHDDAALGLESFNLTPPPSFGAHGALPDFDAPTGFEPFGPTSGTGSPATGTGSSAATTPAAPAADSGPAAAARPSAAPAAPSAEPSADKPAAPEAPAADVADASEGTARTRHGDAGGTTVAELLARLGAEAEPGAGGRRRRRRSED